MRKYTIIFAACVALMGCGGSVELTPEAPQGAVQEGAKEVFFALSYSGLSGVVVDGYGASTLEAAYDALAWMASNKWLPGTPEYKAMINGGLSVTMKEDITCKLFRANVQITPQGLYIDVMGV